jgi:hypothetical protein
MKQSKTMSLIEAVVSILVGFGISLTAQVLILPLLGVAISFSQNLTFALIMTAISIARQYVMRRAFEALHIRRPLSAFMQAVVAERFRQIEQEGWSTEHDDMHNSGELARAGGCYALRAGSPPFDDGQTMENSSFLSMEWPWSSDWWKPAGFRRDLVKACALIIAEGEKFDRSRKSRLPTGFIATSPAELPRQHRRAF